MLDAQPLLVEIALAARSEAERAKLYVALTTLGSQGGGEWHVWTDHESGQIVVAGKSELHLEAGIRRLTEMGAKFDLGSPRVAYRETITRTAEIDYSHRKQTGGSGQFAHVKVRFAPLPPGSGFVFENSLVCGTVP